MAIENIEKAITNIYSDVSKNALVLPRFQRGFVWPRDKQSSLISSFLVDLPYGSLLCLNGKKGDFITRGLCFTSIMDDANETVDYLLDGQQRLSTLRSVIYDLFAEEGIDNWKNTWDKLYPSLRNRWFLRIEADEEEDDLFGYNNLRYLPFNRNTDSDIKDFIEARVINKTKDIEHVYHPDFDKKFSTLSPKERAQKKTEKIGYFSKNKIIPLYEVYKEDQGIHNAVIDKIAAEKAALLKTEMLEYGITPETIFNYFNGFNSIDSLETAEEYYFEHEEDLDSAISSLWSSAQATWAEKFKLELKGLCNRKIPIIKLDQTETSRAIAIFESINKGGVGLSVFDLVVAKAASEQGSDLVTTISTKLSTPINIENLHSDYPNINWPAVSMQVLDGNEPTKQFKDWFVNVLSIHVHLHIQKEALNGPMAIKRESILQLSSANINEHSNKATVGLMRALAFLNCRCGVIKAQDINFKLIVVVLATYLIDDNIWNDQKKLKKLEYWYWLALFSGQYTYRQNEQCIEDIKRLSTFLNSDVNPFDKLRGEILNYKECNRDILLRTDQDRSEYEPGSIRTIMLQFILARGPSDFLTENNKRLRPWDISDNKYTVEIHHIAPLTGATKIEQSTKDIRKNKSHFLNSMLNMAYISKEANRSISDRPATDYLQQLKEYEISSHLVDFNSLKAITDDKEIKVYLESRLTLLKSAINTKLSELVS